MNEDVNEMEEKIKELYLREGIAKNERIALQNNYEQKISSELQALVGRFFITKNGREAFKIIGVPQHKLTMTDCSYIPSYIPVLKILTGHGVLPKITTIRSEAYKLGADQITKEFTEITQQEFEEIVLQELRNIKP